MRNYGERKVLIGSIGVDSGQVMVVDPCYLDKWKANEFSFEHGSDAPRHTEPTGTFDYDGACHATCSEAGHGVLDLRPELGNRAQGTIGMAIASETQYGDGCYPVYAIYEGRNTRPSRLVIEFDESDEENDEEGYLL